MNDQLEKLSLTEIRPICVVRFKPLSLDGRGTELNLFHSRDGRGSGDWFVPIDVFRSQGTPE